MEINQVKVNGISLEQSQNTKSSLPHVSIENNQDSQSNRLSDDVVDISQAAKDKNQEEQDAFKSLRERNTAATGSDTENADSLDEKIKQLQQKLTELTQKLAAVIAKEDAQVEAEQLKAEIALVQTELMSLLNQKVDA